MRETNKPISLYPTRPTIHLPEKPKLRAERVQAVKQLRNRQSIWVEIEKVHTSKAAHCKGASKNE